MEDCFVCIPEEPKKKTKTITIKVKDVFEKKNIPTKTANKVIVKKKVNL